MGYQLHNLKYQNKSITSSSNHELGSRVSEKELSFIQKRIEENFHENIRKVCSTKVYEEIDTIVIKINLERATSDNFKIFNDFVNSECDFKYKNYILDLSSALFMDSTFLGCIIMFYKKIHHHRANFKMVIDLAKIKVLTPFDQLAKILNVHPSVDDALIS